MKNHIATVWIVFILLTAGMTLTACAAQPSPAALVSPTASSTASPTPQPSATDTPNPTPVSPTSTPTAARLCSPIEGAPIPRLTQMVSNPYHPPAAGSDDPHKGIDLAVMAPGSQVAVSGQAVQAALVGRVAGLIFDRFPFGNAIIIETPLENFPADWWSPAQIPTPAPTIESHTALTCPPGPPVSIANASKRSLYVLYAHLQQPPALKIGDTVTCGQTIDTVGDTGNALNPHLHFETRVGPSGYTFSSMAHYDNSATAEEMGSYCLWSVSELFQLVNPIQVLQLAP